MTDKPKILTFDIETSPVEAYVWGLWDQNIPIDFVKTDWTIFAWAAKWLGKPSDHVRQYWRSRRRQGAR